MKILNLITKNHTKTKRKFIDRMIDNKIEAMKIARLYEQDYWDGKRRYGYGGYDYIENYWTPVAKKLIKKFKLNNNSKILDIGCGKGYLLFEIKKILPNIHIAGFDKSKYALKNAHKEIKKNLFTHNAQKKYPFKKKYFDLAISLGCFHNLEINNLKFALNETQRVSKKSYIMVESYRNEKELFNLQCWALTCESFFSKREWEWIFKEFKYDNFYEFIYFS